MARSGSIWVALLAAAAVSGCAGITAAGDPLLYQSLHEGDVALAARLMQSTLENAPDGVTRRWSNTETGHEGAITPTRTYLSTEGRFCREYREELTLGDQTGFYFHTACRDDDERWIWL
jgi:surface antigen